MVKNKMVKNMAKWLKMLKNQKRKCQKIGSIWSEEQMMVHQLDVIDRSHKI